MVSTEREFDETMLSALIAHEITAAERLEGSEDSDRRAENIEYLRGVMKDVKPRPNGSSVTSRDMNDTISWILPSLMRLFTASDHMAIYEPEGTEDDEAAEQATDYANYVFWKDNEGYMTLYNALYDALGVSGDGIVKHWWDDTPVTEITTHTGLTLEQIAALQEDDGVEILTQRQGEPQKVMNIDEMGNEVPMEIETFDVKIERTKRTGGVKVIAIEPENFIINDEAIDIPAFRFIAHKNPNTTKSDLIEMGFDKEKVKNLSASNYLQDSDEELARDSDAFGVTNAIQDSMRFVDLYECYIRIDVDGDGIAETVRAYFAGQGASGEVLDWEVWEDEVPFSKIPCYPRAHEFKSESVSDRVKDIQRLRTVFWRAINDNLVASGLPQREIEAGSVLNPDVLVSPKFGSIIWKKKGSQPIIPHEVQFVADKMYPAMDLLDSIVEKRTGVSRTMMALDPEALQNQTATASQNGRDAAYSQVELIARNMAEGWRKVFKAILKLLVKHQDRSRVIRLRNKYIEVDPRSWNANMDCTVNVGLGTGSRDRDMSMLNLILAGQRELGMQFANAGLMEDAMKMIGKVIETLHDLTESAGIKSTDRYFPEWTDQDTARAIQTTAENAKKPDPVVQIEQAKLEAKVQYDQQKLQLDAEAERMKAEGNAVKERAQMEADLLVKQKEMENNLVLEDKKQSFEAQKFNEEMRFKYEELQLRERVELARIQSARESQEAKAKEKKSADSSRD